MHFDDRLGTVLRLSASGPAVRRIQFRQLLDLLGTSPADARGDQLDAAYVRLAELSATIPTAERARAIGDAGLRLRSPRLVAALAASEPQVAAAALACARLSDEQWLDLVPALSPAARPHLLQRRDLTPDMVALLARLGVANRGLPPAAREAASATPVAVEAEAAAPAVPAPAPVAPAAPEPAEPAPASADEPASVASGISAIVKRIEAYRRAREAGTLAPAADSPRLPLDDEQAVASSTPVAAFNFASDAAGLITWSDPGIAPMVTGLRLTGTAPSAELAQLARRHQPLRAQPVQLAGAVAIAGHWQLDAAPWFDPLTGGFLGYRGRMRRPAAPAAAVAPPADSQADRIRQMLHELRTPVNAIQGFAEVIQQQLFGPTPHEYRALAAGIAGDAARMLSAFEELERLARLDSGAMDLAAGQTELAPVLATTIGQLGAHTAPRGSGFRLESAPGCPAVALDRLEVERIAWRLLATLAGVSAPGEQLALTLVPADGGLRLDLALPATLASRAGDLFDAAAGTIPQTIAAGVFGIGFALRLARAEARAAGGDLQRFDNTLRLTLPGLPATGGGHGDGQQGAAAGAAAE